MELDQTSPDLELQLVQMLTRRLTGPGLEEAAAKIEDKSVVNKEDKDFPHLQIPSLEGRQILKKRAQGRPYFAPYPKILRVLEGIMASIKDKHINEEEIEAMKKREKEVKNLKATQISYKLRMCRIYPPACNKIYSYHL